MVSKPCAKSGRTSRRIVESFLSAAQSEKGFMKRSKRNGIKVKADLVERSAIATARCCHPKSAITNGEHEGNSQIMIATSDVKHMRGQHGALPPFGSWYSARRTAGAHRADQTAPTTVRTVSSSGRLVSIRITSPPNGLGPALQLPTSPHRRGVGAALLQAPRVSFDRRLDWSLQAKQEVRPGQPLVEGAFLVHQPSASAESCILPASLRQSSSCRWRPRFPRGTGPR